MEKLMLKIKMELQRSQNSKTNLEKEEQSWRIHTSQISKLTKNYKNQDSVLSAERQTWKGIEHQEINPHFYVQLFSTRHFNGEGQSFQ
jgi:hypothetical protein